MASEIWVVGWDHDKVAIPEFTTSILARRNPLPVDPYLQDFIENKKWFTYHDVERWWNEYGKKKSAVKCQPDALGVEAMHYEQSTITSVGDLADMLTDFLYKMQKPDGKPVLTKEQTIEAKNHILKGLTVKQVREIIEGVPFTPGFEEAVEAFRGEGLTQTLYSDGLGVAVEHQGKRLNFDAYGGVPAIIELSLYPREKVFSDNHFEELFPTDEEIEEARLTGRVEKYDKWEGFFGSLNGGEAYIPHVAVIDDSAANIKPMKQIQEAGGVAIAFNPTEPHEKQFREAEIPILKQEKPHLGRFKEIVLAEPAGREDLIKAYCV